MPPIKSIRVLSVKRITLNDAVPVFDLTAKINSNFVLASGCIVHNSKDVSDAGACSCYVLLKREANFASVSRKAVGGIRGTHRMSTGRHIKNNSSQRISNGRIQSKLSKRRI